METTIVTYKVKKEFVEENIRLVEAVYQELQDKSHPDVHYATFQKDDGQTFVHIARFASQEGREVLTQSATFQAFQTGIGERCEMPPRPENVSEVGSYRL